jgi:hypothetical protein
MVRLLRYSVVFIIGFVAVFSILEDLRGILHGSCGELISFHSLFVVPMRHQRQMHLVGGSDLVAAS